MREQFVSAFIIGLIVVAIAVGGIVYMQRGAHMELSGAMSVRTVATDPNTALALIDLHLSNPADYGFEVHNVTVTLVNKDGEFPGGVISKVDAKRLFEALPGSGPFHPTLYPQYTIPPKSTADYTIAAQFNAPESILKGRQRFVVRVDEVSGKTAEFVEK